MVGQNYDRSKSNNQQSFVMWLMRERIVVIKVDPVDAGTDNGFAFTVK